MTSARSLEGVTRKIVGYDPGGNGRHGVAALIVEDGRPVEVSFATVKSAHAALCWLTAGGLPFAAGIDTLTVLCMGESGWRPADRWLRQRYPRVRNSVVNPNYLQGSMALNGLAVMGSLRRTDSNIVISESHPKVLYFHLESAQYAYSENQRTMNATLSRWVGLSIETTTEHEWDAVISCYAVFEGLTGRWASDLHQLPSHDSQLLVDLAGPSHFYWPNRD
ncbi:MAG TPA: hypothetical protein VGP63_25220 [Planctomycetaceae bacterium]|jgi:hypothetical protein|nr:hypothetical protein [Planctomycetaceae bacterium]